MHNESERMFFILNIDFVDFRYISVMTIKIAEKL